MEIRGDQRRRAAEPDQSPLEHLVAVSSGKPFENLSWRLLRLLVEDVPVERRELGEGDTLMIVDDVDAIHIERGSLKVSSSAFKGTSFDLKMGPETTAIPGEKSIYENTALIKRGEAYVAGPNTIVRVFFKCAQPRPGLGLPRDPAMSRWWWLCKRSLVARRALLNKAALSGIPGGEVVLLMSKDLVEYLPALTELLAQAMGGGTDREEPSLSVCVVRFDPEGPGYVEATESAAAPSVQEAAKSAKIAILAASGKPLARLPEVEHYAALRKSYSSEAIHWETRAIGHQHPRNLTICTVNRPEHLDLAIHAAKANHDYTFVDPYDRAADLGAVQIKSLTARGRVFNPGPGKSLEVPGSTLSVEQFDAFLGIGDTEGVDSIVHVARNFRTAPRVDGKLNFHAVVLDSRTARFEAGGTRDRRQRRNADDPVPQKIDPVDDIVDDVPTTRLHLNLLRLKKAWEQSARLHEVCEVLDEPNAPATGDRRGIWSSRGFFERWVRDLRFRRVGVALGGGGATGFSHVALIGALRSGSIPIDLVSGTSFGALVGAYYCSHGLDGLEMLAQQALVLTGIASLTMVTSAFFEHLVNVSIDYRPMWELPIPFYAVATDIETGKAAVFPGPAAANPSVGFAVRASGSLPGFFAPALAGDARYIDGAAVSNVPILPLIQRGADIVIGSNAFPFRRGSEGYKPTPLRAFLPPPFGRLAERFIAEINPGNRMMDAARSLSLSLTDSMEKETKLASALYEHKRTDVKYWEFHRAGKVLADATKDLKSGDALPAALNAYRLLNSWF